MGLTEVVNDAELVALGAAQILLVLDARSGSADVQLRR
jgi:hypothetical protein